MSPVVLIFIGGAAAARRGRSERVHLEFSAAVTAANVQWWLKFVQRFTGKFHIMRTGHFFPAKTGAIRLSS